MVQEYPELNVTAPQNCQTVALRVPPDRSFDAVGSIAEELQSVKKGRTEVSGLLVEDSTGVRALMKPEELGSFTALKACKVEHCQRFVFPHSLAALGRALLEIYDEAPEFRCETLSRLSPAAALLAVPDCEDALTEPSAAASADAKPDCALDDMDVDGTAAAAVAAKPDREVILDVDEPAPAE
eukprot:s631_g40.t1